MHCLSEDCSPFALFPATFLLIDRRAPDQSHFAYCRARFPSALYKPFGPFCIALVSDTDQNRIRRSVWTPPVFLFLVRHRPSVHPLPPHKRLGLQRSS